MMMRRSGQWKDEDEDNDDSCFVGQWKDEDEDNDDSCFM